jgi:hypothetical protein
MIEPSTGRHEWARGQSRCSVPPPQATPPWTAQACLRLSQGSLLPASNATAPPLHMTRASLRFQKAPPAHPCRKTDFRFPIGEQVPLSDGGSKLPHSKKNPALRATHPWTAQACLRLSQGSLLPASNATAPPLHMTRASLRFQKAPPAHPCRKTDFRFPIGEQVPLSDGGSKLPHSKARCARPKCSSGRRNNLPFVRTLARTFARTAPGHLLLVVANARSPWKRA